MTRLPGLSAYDRQKDATPQARQARELLWRDNREPSTRDRVLSAGGCWCDEPYGHDWPGKADGAPHPRPEGSPTVSGFDVTVIVLAVLAEPLILLGMLAGLVKLGLLTAHLRKPDKPPTCER